MNERLPDSRDRKVLREAALDLHRMSTAMRQRRGRPIPADEPPGFLDAFASELRVMARMLEGASRHSTVSAAKRQARDLPDPPAIGLARDRAVNAVYVMVNRLAIRAGVDPFSAMKGEDMK